MTPVNAIAARKCSEPGAGGPRDWPAGGESWPDAREAVCLKELGKQASRKGKVLSLKLDNGTTKTFRNNTEENYYLVGFYSTYFTAGAYLVLEQDEWSDYRLVDVHTGETKKLEGVPHLAPDNLTYFIKECEGSSCSISIKSMTPSAPPLWESEDGETGNDWDFVRWIDNDRLVLRTMVTNEFCPSGECDAILKRIGHSWKFKRLPRKSHAK
jgi:hypothetical protein